MATVAVDTNQALNTKEAPAKKPEKKEMTNADRLKLVQGAAGIYFFFINYGKFQEKIFQYKSPAGKKFTQVWFLQVIDALANVIVGGIGRQTQIGGPTPNLPMNGLFMSGCCQVLAKYCMSASLAAGLSFPVATLAKSAKMVPVMIGSMILGGQTFPTRQVAQAAAIVGGTSIVTLSEGGGKKGQGNSKLGILLILAALSLDGLVGGVQKRLKKELKEKGIKEKPYDTMFWTNFYMMVAALGMAGVRGELKPGFEFCKANPSLYGQIVKFSICGAMGQACIFYLIANFDSVVCTAVTTTRKLASVLLSLAEGDKQLSPLGWGGLGLASVGIMGECV